LNLKSKVNKRIFIVNNKQTMYCLIIFNTIINFKLEYCNYFCTVKVHKCL